MKARKTLVFISSIVLSSVLLLAYFGYRIISTPTQPLAYGGFNSHQVWQFDADEVVISSPVAKDGYVFVRTQNTIYALNSDDGKEQWRAMTEADSSFALAPVIDGQYLIVPEKHSGLAVFIATTGELVWRTPPLGIPGGQSTSMESLTTNGGQAYTARFNNKLTAYSLVDGRHLWTQDIPGRTNPYVVSDKNQVYLGAGSSLKVYDALTGRLSWQKDIVNGYVGPMLLLDNVLFVSDEANNTIYALDVQSHKNLWVKKYSELPESFEFNCLAAYDNVLYVAADRLLAISTKDGSPLWITEKLGRLECPVFQENNIYVRNTDSYLYLLDKISGSELGRLKVLKNATMKHEPFRSPIIANGLLIVPFGNNTVYAFDP